MATALPLIVLDEIMLPGPGTEVSLDAPEAAFLRADFRAGVDLFVPVAIGCRAPGGPGRTRLEGREGPGELCPAVLVGEATLVAPDEGDPSERLQLAHTTRARLQRWEARERGWVAFTAPWPLEALAPSEGVDAVAGLMQRFFRMLLATRSSPEGIRRQIEEPVAELLAATGDATQLMLLADYLFEQPSARLAALTATGATELAEMVADALEILEEGAPAHPGALKEPLRAWLRAAQEEGVTGLARIGVVLQALAPLVAPGEEALRRLEALVEDLRGVEQRLDVWVSRALKPGRGKP